MTAGRVLAVDIGGTSTRTAIVDGGRVLARVVTPTSTDLLTAVLSAARRLVVDGTVEAIGVGVPEYVEHGRVSSTEVVAWTDQIVDRLAEIAPVTVESDVRCGALAEWSARPCESLLYVSWGTGISSAFVLPDGSVWEGHRGRAIALGEWRVGSSSLERLASGRGVERGYRDRTGTDLSARDIGARSGDAVAQEVLRSAGLLVAGALRDLVHVLDPARVVLGGGLGAADTAARRAVVAEVGRPPGPVPLVSGAHGTEAGLIGAALVARRPITLVGDRRTTPQDVS